MAWIYHQLTGKFIDATGTVQGMGYSGQPPHKNDPDSQALHNMGPIPCGMWQAVELIPESSTHGPYAIRLEPYLETETFGRSGFMLHGDSIERPGYASDGCIIQARLVREMFWQSLDHDIQVIKGEIA